MKYHITTYGCQMNHSDSERIVTILNCLNYEPALNQNKADLIVINSCSVRQSAIDRIYGQLNNLPKNTKRILTGCVLPKDKKKFGDKFDFILDIKDLADLPRLLENFAENEDRTFAINNYLDIVPDYRNTFSAYIPIMTGCNNFCTYCAVPYTRGREISRPAKEIVNEVKNLVQKGYKEIWLLGQNVNSYSAAIPPNIVLFHDLLRMIDDISGDFWIRFTSPHPKDFSNNLIDALAECKKMTEYINLPVQAGDDRVLKRMNRPYTIQHYIDLIKKIREKNPAIAISTDVIVGFPGETDDQFQRTSELFETIKYAMAYISQYSPRAGTAAFCFKDNVSKLEKVRRDKILNDILKKTALSHNQRYLDQTLEVLVEKERKSFYLGKTRTYKTVRFPKTKDGLVGEFVKVKITEAGPWGIKGVFIGNYKN